MPNQPSAIDQAQALLNKGQTARAVDVIQHAANQGDPGALFQAALWRLIGKPLPRDLAKARQLLRRAAEAGHIDAPLMEVALTANGSGGVEDWAAARDLLARTALTDPIAADHLATINRMSLTPDGDPAHLPQPEWLNKDPGLARFPALLTPEECGYLTAAADGILAPAVVVDPSTGRMINHPIRTSDGALVGPTRENLVIRTLNRRLAAISDTRVQHGEPLSILRYKPGQQYRLHSDALPGNVNQRVATILVYLNDDFEGGETQFPALGVTVKPARGDVVLFENITETGAPDQRMNHAGLPVTRGVKWLATRWIRAAPYDPWTAR